jgi:hypothetical protein
LIRPGSLTLPVPHLSDLERRSQAFANRFKEATMEETIKIGSLIIAEGTLLPESMLIESEPYINGWRLIKNLDSKGFDQIISRAGWNFIYLAGAIETSAFGSDEKKTTHKAIKKVIANLGSRKFNCLEITQVTAKRSIGFPCMSVSAHSRQIQKSILL